MTLELSQFDSWTTAEKVTVLTRANRIPGYPDQEIELMVNTVCEFRPYWVIEWGTNRGTSARIFYEAARFIGLEMVVHTIELPDNVSYHEHPREECGLFVRGCENVNQHRGDGLTEALALLKHLPQRATLIFLDGDHSSGVVSRELDALYEQAPEACLLLHDTGHEVSGPRDALASFIRKHPNAHIVTELNPPGHPGVTRLWPR